MARRLGLKQVPIVLRDDLDDERMLQLMGRENLDEYRADFQSLLETWEAAVAWLEEKSASPDFRDLQDFEIAQF